MQKNNISVMFPGQGSQYIGMGKNLYDKYEFAKKTFKDSNKILGFDLSAICFDGKNEDLIKTTHAQPAIFVVSFIMYNLYVKNKNIHPLFFLGHSLGEITALCCTGAIDFSNTLKLIKLRSTYMQNCCEKGFGSMFAVIGKNLERINHYCKSFSSVEISNYNSPKQIVISGKSEDLVLLKEFLKKEGFLIFPLQVYAPFHSKFMKSATENFKKELKKYKYKKINFPLISNVTAKPYLNEYCIVNNLSEQITKPVMWKNSIKYAFLNGTDLFLEVGPKNVLKNLSKDICPNIRSLSLDHEDDLNEWLRYCSH